GPFALHRNAYPVASLPIQRQRTRSSQTRWRLVAFVSGQVRPAGCRQREPLAALALAFAPRTRHPLEPDVMRRAQIEQALPQIHVRDPPAILPLPPSGAPAHGPAVRNATDEEGRLRANCDGARIP